VNKKHLKKKANQQNDSTVIVVLYNNKKQPVEILAITQIDFDTYISDDLEFTSYIESKANFMIDNLVHFAIKTFGINNLNKFSTLYEPIVGEDYDKKPILITKRKSEFTFLADTMKVKPVLTYGKKDLRIALDIFRRAIRVRNIHRI
jgi:hypothetical protein